MNAQTINRREIAIQTIISLIILLFIYAASSKLLDYTRFRVELGKSPLLTAFAGLVAWSIPVIEIGIALLLAFVRTRLLGLYASFTLMVLFTAYIVYILNFSPYVPCSCGGVLQKLDWRTHLIFNSVFVVLAGIGAMIYKPAPQQAHKPFLRNFGAKALAP